MIPFQDAKLSNNLVNKHGQNLEEKSLTICSGTDYININYQHVVCPDANTANVCMTIFIKITCEYNIEYFILQMKYNYLNLL